MFLVVLLMVYAFRNLLGLLESDRLDLQKGIKTLWFTLFGM